MWQTVLCGLRSHWAGTEYDGRMVRQADNGHRAINDDYQKLPVNHDCIEKGVSTINIGTTVAAAAATMYEPEKQVDESSKTTTGSLLHTQRAPRNTETNLLSSSNLVYQTQSGRRRRRHTDHSSIMVWDQRREGDREERWWVLLYRVTSYLSSSYVDCGVYECMVCCESVRERQEM